VNRGWWCSEIGHRHILKRGSSQQAWCQPNNVVSAK
jgi:hypothetical protein